jgi:hypothetical protein
MRPTDYSKLLNEMGITTVKRDVWAYSEHNVNTVHGWKLHISSTQSEIISLLQQRAPFLRNKISFKVIHYAF